MQSGTEALRASLGLEPCSGQPTASAAEGHQAPEPTAAADSQQQQQQQRMRDAYRRLLLDLQARQASEAEKFASEIATYKSMVGLLLAILAYLLPSASSIYLLQRSLILSCLPRL